MSRVPRYLAALSGLTLILMACTGGTTPTTAPAESPSPSADMPMSSGDPGEGFAWGEPAEPGDADRVLEVRMTDELRFDPGAIDVTVGETITFKVTNVGKIPHDFTLGDDETQAEHEAEMAAGGMAGTGHEEPNVLSLESGEMGELTWRFTGAGTILYGCHLPGHYAAGMLGTLTIGGS